MHVVVSMYFDTVAACRRPVFVPSIEAEERVISSACTLIVVSSRFLQLHEERFVLRRPRVGVADRWRQEIRQRTLMALLCGIAPVNGESDVPHFFAIDFHR